MQATAGCLAGTGSDDLLWAKATAASIVPSWQRYNNGHKVYITWRPEIPVIREINEPHLLTQAAESFPKQ
jgi:hypothetical protein